MSGCAITDFPNPTKNPNTDNASQDIKAGISDPPEGIDPARLVADQVGLPLRERQGRGPVRRNISCKYMI